MSTHAVNIVEIDNISKHANADRLAVVNVGGWQCVVGADQFKIGDKAVYIEPDYVVDTSWPEFAFLDKKGEKAPHRLKAVKLRGALSYGLLIPCPPSLATLPVGTNVMTDLGITRYVPPVRPGNVSFGDTQELGASDRPKVQTPKFDLENLQRYPDIIQPGELVYITEKIDGTNARYMWHDGKMFVGSRNRWLKPDSDNVWVRVMNATPEIVEFCEDHPDHILYGEIYGPIQALKYGLTTPKFAAFSMFDCNTGEWFSMIDELTLPCAPVIYTGPYDAALVKYSAERDSTVPFTPPGHMREGVVITPVNERSDPNIGRVSLKYISQRYWLDKNT